MNKGIKIAIAVIVGIWVFFMGYEIGTYRETKKMASKATTSPVVYQPQQTLPMSTQPTAATQPNVSVQDTTSAQSPATTAATTQAAADTALSKTDILAQVTKAVNATKGYTGSFTATCTQTKQLGITDCSVPSLTNTIDNIVQKFVGGGETKTYTFANGTGTDSAGATVTPGDAIPPRSKAFSLTEQGMASATSQKNGADTVYSISLIAETATLDVLPANNSSAAGYLDLSKLSILSGIEYSYPATVIDATVNQNGLLSAMHVYMPISAVGTGKVLSFEGSASFSGSLDETWSFSYT